MQPAKDNEQTRARGTHTSGGDQRNRSRAERSSQGQRATRWHPGDVIAERTLATITGKSVRLPDAERLVHLQLRRFAGCPICNLHLQSVVRRHDEILAAGIREVVVFHSTAEELRAHASDLPFDVVADPDKRLYAEFGVESSPRAVLDPRAWGKILRAVLRSLWAIVRGQRPLPPINPQGGVLGLPADVLIARDGRVVACKYGDHASDQWSVDELLDVAHTERASLSAAERGTIYE